MISPCHATKTWRFYLKSGKQEFASRLSGRALRGLKLRKALNGKAFSESPRGGFRKQPCRVTLALNGLANHPRLPCFAEWLRLAHRKRSPWQFLSERLIYRNAAFRLD